MTDTLIPEDLVELKRRFLAEEARQAQLAATLPASMAIATGQASLTEEQQADWTRIQTRLTELAVDINRHPALAGLSAVDRYALDRAATKAAKEAAEQADHPAQGANTNAEEAAEPADHPA